MDNKRNFRLIKNLDWQNPISATKGVKKISAILESGTLEEMKRVKAYQEELIAFHWKLYQELAFQREQIKDKIFEALLSSAQNDYSFDRYQRAVKYRYSLHPLCTLGSLDPPGGRFNVGDVNGSIRSVPALYVGQDKDTALQETLGQESVDGQELTARELALANPESETIVSVSGKLDYVLDLRTHLSLKRFVACIRNFKLSPSLKKEAKRLNMQEPGTVKNPSQLHADLMSANWRHLAALFDIPWNSQIFGNLCADAGLQGVAYHSVKSKKPCIVIYPENFKNSSSFIALDDEAPAETKVTKLDHENYHLSLLSHKQL
jgi:hypothetical protein